MQRRYGFLRLGSVPALACPPAQVRDALGALHGSRQELGNATSNGCTKGTHSRCCAFFLLNTYRFIHLTTPSEPVQASVESEAFGILKVFCG
jgi:hypothetical protein